MFLGDNDAHTSNLFIAVVNVTTVMDSDIRATSEFGWFLLFFGRIVTPPKHKLDDYLKKQM